MEKILANVFQHKLTRWSYIKTHIKRLSNSPRRTPHFRVKSKMAAIKPVFFFKNPYHLRNKHRGATYNMSFRAIFSEILFVLN